MSGITKLHCDNCAFWVRNRNGKPVLQDENGEEFHIPEPIGPQYHKYIVGYRHQKYCSKCRGLVWLFVPVSNEKDAMICPNCSTESIVQAESACPECKQGAIRLDIEVML